MHLGQALGSSTGFKYPATFISFIAFVYTALPEVSSSLAPRFLKKIIGTVSLPEQGVHLKMIGEPPVTN
jgi:hypothetical protein